MYISILEWQPHTDIDLSRKWAEVIELSEADAIKLRAKTHSFDIESKELVELPQSEPEPIIEPTPEELKEIALKEIEKMILRKQAMELVGETVGTIVDEIKLKAEEVIDLGKGTREEKTELKISILEKL